MQQYVQSASQNLMMKTAIGALYAALQDNNFKFAMQNLAQWHKADSSELWHINEIIYKKKANSFDLKALSYRVELHSSFQFNRGQSPKTQHLATS